LADLKLLNGIINGAGVYILDGIIDDGINKTKDIDNNERNGIYVNTTGIDDN